MTNILKNTFLSILALLAGMLFSCKNDIKEVQSVTTDSILPLETAQNIEFVYSDSSRLKFRVVATKMNRFGGDEPKLEFTNGLEVFAYNALGEVDSKIQAEYGISYENKGFMEAKNNVIIVNREGDQLNTEHITWDQTNKLIKSEVFVKITTENEVIYGDGLEASEDFSKYKILNIKGIINLNEDSLNNTP